MTSALPDIAVTAEDWAELEAGPPPYRREVASRVATRLDITDVQLLAAHFQRVDEWPLDSGAEAGVPDSIAISVDSWALAGLQRRLGCVLTFGVVFEDEDGEVDEQAPYECIARFRITYHVAGDERLTEDDVAQFVHWRRCQTSGPYWREYLSSTLDWAGLPRYLIPLITLPRRDN